jgi:hypothetical protein
MTLPPDRVFDFLSLPPRADTRRPTPIRALYGWRAGGDGDQSTGLEMERRANSPFRARPAPGLVVRRPLGSGTWLASLCGHRAWLLGSCLYIYIYRERERTTEGIASGDRKQKQTCSLLCSCAGEYDDQNDGGGMTAGAGIVVKISGVCCVARQNIPRSEVRRSPAGLVPVPVGGGRRAGPCALWDSANRRCRSPTWCTSCRVRAASASASRDRIVSCVGSGSRIDSARVVRFLSCYILQ